MKKILFTLFAILLFIVGCSSNSTNDSASPGSSTSNQTEEKYTIRVPLLGSDTNFVNKSYAVFKEKLEERSEGRFEVQIYGSGTLANAEQQQMELVARGDAELTSIATGIITNHAGASSFGIFDVPFMFTSDETLYNFLDSDLAKKLDEELESKIDVKVVGNYDMKGYNIFNGVRKVETPNDLAGLKLRTSPIDLQVNLLRELGANPTPLAYGEAFTALQQGAIDGIHIATGLGWTDKFYEVSKYLTLTRHVALVHYIMINNDFLESLPEDLRTILEEELNNLVQEARKQSIETDSEALQVIKDSGIEVTELTAEQFEAFREASQNTIKEAVEIAGEAFYQEVSQLINN